MKRRTKGMAGLAVTAMAVFGSVVGAAAPAHADTSSCTVSPPAGTHGGSPASVTCPAGAGAFTFRVAATCADAYPTLHLFSANGPWVSASATSSTTSSVPCNGAVPGSGFVWSASIEVQ
jgi:hypothetical protein